MANEQMNTAPEENENHKETDIQKIVQRHMQNKDDVITDEDIRYAKIGDSDEIPALGAEVEAKLEKDEERKPNDEPLTPWDLKS